jgi:hypothetical protein
MMQRRWVVFAVQAIAMALIWGFFLTFLAKRPWDGWFAVEVIGVALIVASVGLWKRSGTDKRQGKT